MTKAAQHGPAGSVQTVRSEKTGEFVAVRGVGALKGQLRLQKGVDLTKPIASQVLGGGKSSGDRKR
jgi:hypothetical protein